MKISIITVCYNSAKTLEQTIQSVISQKFANKEYIIIDGASKDGTLEIIEKYKGQIQYFISEPDQGIYDAMNKGIAAASGDVVGILNSDDIYKSDGILDQVATAFTADTDCICTDVEIFKESQGNIVRYYSCTKWKTWMFRLGHQPPHPGFFVRKECYNKFGNFDTRFKIAADFDLLFRFIKKEKCRTLFLPWVSILMRSGGASRNILQANKEVHLALKKNGVLSSPILIWSKYLIKIFQFWKIR